MISVERLEWPAAPGDADAVLGRLDAAPGVWMGCDVAAEGLFRKGAVACAVLAVRFCLEGDALRATALTPAGAGLLVAFEAAGGKRDARVASGGAVLGELRRFLGLFDAPPLELAYYVAFSFDYFRIGQQAALPGDGRRRVVLYFPERVLVVRETGALWIRF